MVKYTESKTEPHDVILSKQTVPPFRTLWANRISSSIFIQQQPINQYLLDRTVRSIKNITTHIIQIYFRLSQRDFKRGSDKCIGEILRASHSIPLIHQVSDPIYERSDEGVALSQLCRLCVLLINIKL